jgi:membrane-associated protease RseP (regulator of RpoE activity)
MTETKGDRTATIAVVTGVIALLLGLCLGALAGGIGGYFIGRGVAPGPVTLSLPERVAATPTPSQPQLPEIPTPQLPERLRRNGVLIQEVVKGSPAAEAGLRVGDIITKVDDTSIDAQHRLSDILKGHKPGDRVTLTVWQLGDTRKVNVKLGEHPDDPKRSYLGIYYVELAVEPRAPGQ